MALAGWPRPLRVLRLAGCDVGNVSAAQLAMTHVTDTLALIDLELTESQLVAIVQSPRLQALRTLVLRGGVTARVIAALLASELATSLVELDLADNALDAEAARLLAAAPLPALRTLSLARSALPDDAVATLADARWLAHLRTLDLADLPIGDAAAYALARAPHARTALGLWLAGTACSEPAMSALRDRFDDVQFRRRPDAPYR